MCVVKFIYSEKATKFGKISTLLLSCVVPVKSKVEILQNFVVFLRICELYEIDRRKKKDNPKSKIEFTVRYTENS